MALRRGEMDTRDLIGGYDDDFFSGVNVIARGSSANDDDAWWPGLLNGKPRF
jgi:hypothetical protein